MEKSGFLFDVLPARVFNPFGLDATRKAYEVLLRTCILGPFSRDGMEAVEKAELQGMVERTLAEFEAEHPGLECPAASAAMQMMFRAGWFTEHREGWRTIVEMDRSVAILAEFLCRELPAAVENVSFGEGIASVDAMLQSANDEPNTHAGAILEAAKSAKRFAANVRAIAGTLRGIEKAILSKPTTNDVVIAFFDDYVARIHAGDYAQLTSSKNHPYHLRLKVIRVAEEMGNHETLYHLASALAAVDGRNDIEAHHRILQGALDDIIEAMDVVERVRRRIDASKASIERRFLNTIRQVEMSDPARDRRLKLVANALQAMRGISEAPDLMPDVGLAFVPPVAHLSPEGWKEPPKPRQRVEPKPSKAEKPDPLLLAYEKACTEFLASLRHDGILAARQLADLAGGHFQSTDVTPSTSQEMAILHCIVTLPLAPDGTLQLGEGYLLRRLSTLASHGVMDIPRFEVMTPAFVSAREQEVADAAS